MKPPGCDEHARKLYLPGVRHQGEVTESAVTLFEAYVSHAIGNGRLYIGQLIPFRALDDQTSSNDLTMVEGAITGASGVYRGGSNRLYQIGMGYLTSPTSSTTFGVNGFNLRREGSSPTEGFGGAARATWLARQRGQELIHLGLSATFENPQGDDAVGNVGTVFSYAGILGPTASLGGTANGDHAAYLAGEIATVYGPTVLQGEYVSARYGQGQQRGAHRVDAYHLSLSHALSGEIKPYDRMRGTFSNLRPLRTFGALELTARFEHGQAFDANAADAIRQVRSSTIGVNWYVTPMLRIMLNYVSGKAKRVDGESDSPQAIAARVQLNW